jgi:cysteine-rich repeat protein
MRRILFISALALCSCSIPEFHYPPGPPVIDSFTASLFELSPGGTTRISWQVSEATEVELRLPEESFTEATTGSRELVLSDSLPIELVARGVGGESRSLLTVLVRDPEPVEIAVFDVAPLQPARGEAVSIVWDARGATYVSLVLDNGEILLEDAPSRGSLQYRSDFSYAIELRAEGFGGPKVARREVTVHDPTPYIIELSVNPPVIRSTEFAFLSFRTANATSARVVETRDSGGSTTTHFSVANGSGSMVLSGSGGSRTIRFIATGPGGTAEESARLLVRPPRSPEILELTLEPANNGPGGETLIRYSTRYADDVRLELGAASMSVPPSGALRMAFEETQTVRLTARVSATDEEAVRERTVVIDAARPRIKVSAAPALVEVDRLATITFECDRADSVRIYTEAGLEVHRTDENTGSFVAVSSTPVVYFIEATNAAGTTVRAVPLTVLSPPQIIELDVPPVARINRPARISWRTLNAITGAVTVENFAPFQINGAEIASGSFPLFPSNFGIIEVVLHASSLVSTATATENISVLEQASNPFEVEPNGDQASANGPYFGLENFIEGSLENGDLDMFVVAHGPGLRSRVTVDGLENCSVPVRIEVYEEDNVLDIFEPLESTPENESCPTVDAREMDVGGLRESTVYALQLTNFEPVPIPYTFISVLEVAFCGDGVRDRGEQCDDGNLLSNDGCSSCTYENLTEFEPNNFTTEANAIFVDEPTIGYLNDNDADVYTFTVPADRAGPMRISLGESGEPCPRARLTLFHPDHEVTDAPANGCALLDGPRLDLAAGSYVLRVEPGAGASRDVRGPYTLLVDAP